MIHKKPRIERYEILTKEGWVYRWEVTISDLQSLEDAKTVMASIPVNAKHGVRPPKTGTRRKPQS
jgi:hypothetical protein